MSPKRVWMSCPVYWPGFSPLPDEDGGLVGDGPVTGETSPPPKIGEAEGDGCVPVGPPGVARATAPVWGFVGSGVLKFKIRTRAAAVMTNTIVPLDGMTF